MKYQEMFSGGDYGYRKPLLLRISLAPTGFYGRLAGRGLASLTENATGRCVNRLRQWYLSDCLMFE